MMSGFTPQFPLWSTLAAAGLFGAAVYSTPAKRRRTAGSLIATLMFTALNVVLRRGLIQGFARSRRFQRSLPDHLGQEYFRMGIWPLQISARADLLLPRLRRERFLVRRQIPIHYVVREKPAANRLHPNETGRADGAGAGKQQQSGDCVLDLFGGFGSKLIAFERRGRNPRLMEPDPKYADVIVKRWQEYTGKPALLDEDGAPFEKNL
jgi:hypothetical protein